MNTETAHNNSESAIESQDEKRQAVLNSPAAADEQDNKDPVRHRRSNGKVARLPKEIRHQVNEMLDDGFTYAAIIESLGEHGKGLDEDHIRRWKARGYQEYLRQQRLLEQCRSRSDRSLSQLRSSNPLNGFQATQQLATAQICETVADVGTDILREALAANPLNYFRMLNSFARLTNGGIKCERHLLEDLERKAKLRKQKSPRKNGVSKESLREMEEKLKLM